MEDSEQMEEVKRMKRILTLSGILLTMIILINGSTVAGTTHWIVDVAWENHCTNPDNAEGPYDGKYASIGENPDTPGEILLDFGAGNGIPNGYEFTVYASSSVYETYDVSVNTAADNDDHTYVGRGGDTGDENFNAPATGGPWRYVYIDCVFGDEYNLDPAFGPEIDAVSWYEP
jgi:hypothetical protein